MRIRTVKPELFRHEDLFDAEEETGLPLRLAFIGMFCVADREGRFVWKVRTLKSQVMPFDSHDFSRVLDALVTRGFLVTYEVNGVKYGVIPSFGRHQQINNRERQSEIPPPPEILEKPSAVSRESRVDDASTTRHEGKGKEQGKEGNKERKDSCPPESDDDDLVILSKPTWEILWNRSPEKARRRSSRKQVEDEWKRIKVADRPELNVLTQAFEAWLTCEDWTKDEGEFVPGLHLWFKRRQWENPPAPEIKTKASESAEELMGGRKMSVVSAADLNLEPTPDDDIPFD